MCSNKNVCVRNFSAFCIIYLVFNIEWKGEKNHKHQNNSKKKKKKTKLKYIVNYFFW